MRRVQNPNASWKRSKNMVRPKSTSNFSVLLNYFKPSEKNLPFLRNSRFLNTNNAEPFESKRKRFVEKVGKEMGRGERREEEQEGVMATDFFWSYTDEPHASRRRQILSQYPQIKELFGPDPLAFLKITVVVLLQLWTATTLHGAGWLKILGIAYFFGSFLNHNLFLAIHELSHNLAFSTPVYNRWLGIFANLPIGVPMSVTFQKYHLEHHRFQGVDGIDMDIPSQTEARVVTNVVTKFIWVIFQLFFYALRPLFLKPKPPGYWEFINLFIQIGLDVAMVWFWGWKSFAYLILSTFVGGGMHPMAGHFISEHYVFNPDQETYSYYGPLNLLTWSVGYHNEHHDFPRIPGSKLYKVKEIAPEYYDSLESYKSWSQIIYTYVMDRTIGPCSRMKRKPATTKKST